ncbi:Probable diguanylate cyclase YcdT [Delftia tsuruhatensis]|uniref:GGDEF domain-containing protein n=1 Tax=Delftia tsuruhatensis TaxID=180282 RepID=UPI001E72A236|nr:GGDEF domain-containing protein [Delftia tsuruhatensis]CAB5707964.1 Probable diguanylate cyclase YcdT [Delftia tsuruhatensis]CAC9680556.1 Probable diguanylate cyclase YcdT [Delftia tsuruhatensis]
MSFAFAGFSLAQLAQILGLPAAMPLNVLVTAALQLGAAWFITQAIAMRHSVQPDGRLAAGLGGAVLAVLGYYAWMQPDVHARQHVLDFGLGLQLALPLWRLPRERPVGGCDRLLLWVFVVFALSFLVRTLMVVPRAVPAAEAGPAGGEWLGASSSWMALQLSLLVFGLLFATLFLALAVRDTVQALHEERDRDPLTGLLNRRAFREAVQRLRAEQPGLSAALLVCDVDHFKRVNDGWGHAAGDEVLQRFARLLLRSTRQQDLVARFGGEEFVALLPGADPRAAQSVTRRMRNQLRLTGFSALPDDQRITASFGVAWLEPGQPLEQALARADAMLYEAKRAGRDRVRLAREVPQG